MAFDDENPQVSPFPEDEFPDDFNDDMNDDFGDDTDIEKGLDDLEEPSGGAPNNKTFIIAVAALIGFLVIAMALMAAYAIFVAPRKRSAQQTQVAQVNAQNTAIAQGLTATAMAAAWTPTPTPAPPTSTPTPVVNKPTATPVVVAPSNATPTVAINATAFALTATAIYRANATAAALTPTPTALAQTGFADQAGLPGLIAIAALLILVIFLARRMRKAV